LVRDEGVNVPIIGVAKSDWKLDQLKDRAVEPILDNVTSLYQYASGEWGPAEAERLIGSDGPWINPNISAAAKAK
jgi:hypothetical protein